jgi:hypothetical protein
VIAIMKKVIHTSVFLTFFAPIFIVGWILEHAVSAPMVLYELVLYATERASHRRTPSGTDSINLGNPVEEENILMNINGSRSTHTAFVPHKSEAAGDNF